MLREILANGMGTTQDREATYLDSVRLVSYTFTT